MFQRPIEIYPWNPDWVTVWMILGTALLTILLIYFSTRQGRMEKRSTDVPGKPPIHHYAGIISSDSNPIPVFVWAVIILAVMWTIGYNVVISIKGLGY